MSRDEAADEKSRETLRRELSNARATIQELEDELVETNEGMIALTLELEKAKKQYQKIFEASTSAILLIDPEEDAIYEANPRACELFGYSHDALVSLSASDIFPDESGRHDSFVDAVFRGWVDGFSCRTNDGKTLEIEISASAFKLEGRSLLLVAMQDVTRRKRREQRLQVLNRLFRHNLRNDGNVIQGHATMLQEQLADSKHRESASIIRKTIDQILGWSRKVRRIQDVLDREYVSPVEFSEMLEKLQRRLQRTYPETTIVIEPPRDVVVGHRLSPALHEAIENAIKHNDQTEPSVRVSGELDEEGEQLVVTVTDQGPGIPEQERNVIREGEESPLEHGSGVGLWFIRWVISSLGGELTIQENDPRGTRVSMVVPIQEENESRHYGGVVESVTYELAND